MYVKRSLFYSSLSYDLSPYNTVNVTIVDDWRVLTILLQLFIFNNNIYEHVFYYQLNISIFIVFEISQQ